MMKLEWKDKRVRDSYPSGAFMLKMAKNQFDYANEVGRKRREMCSSYNFKPRYGADKAGNLNLKNDQESCCAEYAVALWQDVPYDGNLGDIKADDAGDLQVRSSTNPNNRSLIIHDSDNDDKRFVFVHGKEGTYVIAGWIWGREGKRQEFWKTNVRHPAYFVPLKSLRKMSEWDNVI